jgi:hypothetical protein
VCAETCWWLATDRPSAGPLHVHKHTHACTRMESRSVGSHHEVRTHLDTCAVRATRTRCIIIIIIIIIIWSACDLGSANCKHFKSKGTVSSSCWTKWGEVGSLRRLGTSRFQISVQGPVLYGFPQPFHANTGREPAVRPWPFLSTSLCFLFRCIHVETISWYIHFCQFLYKGWNKYLIVSCVREKHDMCKRKHFKTILSVNILTDSRKTLFYTCYTTFKKVSCKTTFLHISA